MGAVLHLIFFEPRIPGNTGAAIRLSANTGAMLHLVDPLFDMDDAKLRRAGLDYHDLARTRVHATWEECLEAVPGRILAFTAHTPTLYTQVDWRADDALLFGPEPTGLPEGILSDARISARVRIPMVEGNRSLNLANSAAIGLYEAWRTLGFPGGQ
ncbi:putative tRNA (cytidine(34)-2'-O)-methyltransferase [Actinomyces capricornis]|uniref:Putative tRNA (cytidine(34)-2'-O)-methyltransferase n=1 Tax=Actinomyces capricornis TaxID=2755559 RepID=A0ABM7UQ00_9ACTO|nr:tRNA (cytidine(34)-2'-O)-methyltransferase [Actinomyces bowdenii]BDA65415.1 putative tRNA (cytidine(34)-2'-O)-methyltransferase [Actinomyces capricornis]